MPSLLLTADETALTRGGRRFDPATLDWGDDPVEGGGDVLANPVDPWCALLWLYRQPATRRVPIAVIGPKEATPAQMVIAEEVGRRLGEIGAPLVTGGREGVMEAASKGHAGAGGQPIGILPGDEWQTANPYVAVPIATGLGPARNAVIARAAIALIAIGGEHGTLTEMAFGIHFDRLVVALDAAPEVPGAIRCATIDEALDRVALRILRLDR